MYTKEAIALARACYEAIPKIAKKAGKKCPKCKGSGEFEYQILPGDPMGNTDIEICPKCNGTGGEWKWLLTFIKEGGMNGR